MNFSRIPAIIAASGTEALWNIPAGQRVIGVELPTVDSTTIVPTLSSDGVTYRAVYDSAGVLITVGGAANVGNRYVAFPDSLSRLTEGHFLKLTTASQTGGARSLTAICADTEA